MTPAEIARLCHDCAQDIANERDRYKAALERIAWHADNGLRDVAREALKGAGRVKTENEPDPATKSEPGNQVQTAQPKWTTEPPTKPGLYWARLVKKSSSGVVYTNGGQVVLVDLKGRPSGNDVLSYDLWAGPIIEAPEVPEGVELIRLLLADER